MCSTALRRSHPQAQLFLRESEELTQLLPARPQAIYSWRNKRIIYYEEKELVA